jgi:hypothetical protein
MVFHSSRKPESLALRPETYPVLLKADSQVGLFIGPRYVYRLSPCTRIMGTIPPKPNSTSSRRKKMIEANVDRVAEMIVHSPKLRMDYFANPEKLLTKVAAEAGVQRDQLPRLGSTVEEKINNDSRLVSSREAYGERETFLKEAMRNPQVAFDTILWMSIVTFIIGIALVAGAFVAVFAFEDNTAQQVIISSLSGELAW